jgi:hypothetical protein
MDIGKPERVIVVEPTEIPVPAKDPAETRSPSRDESPRRSGPCVTCRRSPTLPSRSWPTGCGPCTRPYPLQRDVAEATSPAAPSAAPNCQAARHVAAAGAARGECVPDNGKELKWSSRDD